MKTRIIGIFGVLLAVACGAGNAGSEPPVFPEAAAVEPEAVPEATEEAVEAEAAPSVPLIFVDTYKLGVTTVFKQVAVGAANVQVMAAAALYEPDLCSDNATAKRKGDRVKAGTLPKDMLGTIADYRLTGSYTGAVYITKPDAHGSVVVICNTWHTSENGPMREAFLNGIRAAVPSCCTTGFSEKTFEEVMRSK